MYITGSGTINKDSVKTLSRTSMFSKGNPRRRMLIYVGTFVACDIFFIVTGIASKFDFFSIWGISVSTLGLLLQLTLYFLIPATNCHSSKKVFGLENRYEFHDTELNATTDTPEAKGTSTLAYSTLIRVRETDKYLFLTLPNNTSLIVEKSTLQGNENGELQAKLKENVSKYIRYKY